MTEKRTIGSRLVTGGIGAVAAFSLGFTVLSSSIGWQADGYGVIPRVVFGVAVAFLGLLLGLVLSRRLALGCLSMCLLVAVPSFIGSFDGSHNTSRIASRFSIDSTDAHRIFRDNTHRVSFRYPSNWESVPPQLKGTLVMLHAQDGSFATCNLSVRSADSRTVEEMDEAYWNSVLSKAYPDAKVRNVRFVDAFGDRRVIIEYDFTLVTSSARIPASSLTLATIRDGKRYMLILNAKKERVELVRPVFDIMASTLMFDTE